MSNFFNWGLLISSAHIFYRDNYYLPHKSLRDISNVVLLHKLKTVRMHVNLDLFQNPECHMYYGTSASFSELYDVVMIYIYVFRIRSLSQILFYNSLFLLAADSFFQ